MNGMRSSPGGPDRLEPQRRVLGRRALVGHQVGPQRLEHQALRGRDLAQAGEVLARQRAQVRVREQAALQRPLAAPGHVGHEVVEPELGQPRPHAGMVPGVVAGEHEQLLHPAAHRAVQQALDLVGLVEVRPVGGERAVLAVRDAGPRERQRQVPGESDASRHHPLDATAPRSGSSASPSLPPRAFSWTSAPHRCGRPSAPARWRRRR